MKHTNHVKTRSNHHPGNDDVHSDNTLGTVADLEAVVVVDTLQRNTLGTHEVAPVVGIQSTLAVVLQAVGTLRTVVLLVGTLVVGKVVSTLSQLKLKKKKKHKPNSKLKTEKRKRN
jgi:uncharacterized protein with ACT and thioredoxin-like domain